jgi:hypothetical protein
VGTLEGADTLFGGWSEEARLPDAQAGLDRFDLVAGAVSLDEVSRVLHFKPPSWFGHTPDCGSFQ